MTAEQHLILKTVHTEMGKGEIIFSVPPAQREMLRLCSNGDIYVRGVLADSDLAVVDGMREFLRLATTSYRAPAEETPDPDWERDP